VVLRDLGTEAMLYDPEGDQVVRPNRIARRIWEMCTGQNNLNTIAAVGTATTSVKLLMKHPRSGTGAVERVGDDLPVDDLATLWARADDQQTRSYRICGQVLRLRCDSPAYARSFEAAFGQLRCDDASCHDRVNDITFLTRAVGPGGFPALIDLRDARLRVFAYENVEPTQLFSCLAFLEKGMLPLQDHVILHGAVLEHDDAVTAIVGRTHSGKSTLGLRLALEPGFSFLSDEYCPIRLADGVVEPFPRSLGLRRQARLLLAQRGALAADVLASAALQIDVDPGNIRGLRIGGGGLLRSIVILSGEGVAALHGERRLLDLQFVNPSVLGDLRAIAGVLAVQVIAEPAGFGTTVAIDVATSARVADDIIRVCRVDHRMELVSFLPANACRPDFTRPPVLKALAPVRGIIEVLRYVVNHAALARRLGNGYPRLLDCLASRLGGVRFFSLCPGPLEETSRLLQRTVFES